MWKRVKDDLSDLVNDISRDSIKSISWELIHIVPKKHVLNSFWENCLQVTNEPNLTFPIFKNDL